MNRLIRGVLLIAIAPAFFFARPYILPERALEVNVFRVELGEVRETVTSPSSGTVVSAQEATVSAEASARVATIHLREGDQVGDGAVVIELESADAAVEVRAAEAALATRRTALDIAALQAAKAEDDLASAEPLHARGLMAKDQFRVVRTLRDTTRLDVEAARRAVAEAEVAVERARVALERRTIEAPFPGVIRRMLVEVGETVAPGAPCFEIYDHRRIFVRAPLDEVDIPRVSEGLATLIALEPFGDHLFRGALRKIAPGVQTGKELNRTVEVEVDLVEAPAKAAQDASYPSADGPLRVGMSADIEVVTRTRTGVLRVPHYAVHEDEGGRFVYLVADGRIVRRTVTVGLWNWDYAEIASGLLRDDPVVVSLDLEELKPGKPAKIKREVRKVEVD